MGIVSNLVAKAVRRQGLASKSALAREIDCAPTRLYAWESGARPCPPGRIKRLAELAGVDPTKTLAAYLIEREESG